PQSASNSSSTQPSGSDGLEGATAVQRRLKASPGSGAWAGATATAGFEARKALAIAALAACCCSVSGPAAVAGTEAREARPVAMARASAECPRALRPREENVVSIKASVEVAWPVTGHEAKLASGPVQSMTRICSL